MAMCGGDWNEEWLGSWAQQPLLDCFGGEQSRLCSCFSSSTLEQFLVD